MALTFCFEYKMLVVSHMGFIVDFKNSANTIFNDITHFGQKNLILEVAFAGVIVSSSDVIKRQM